MESKRRCWMAALILVFVATTCLLGGVDGDVKKSFQVGVGGRLTLETDIGSVEVQSRDGNTLDVEVLFQERHGGRRRMEDFLEDFDIDFQQRGNDVFVKAEYLRDRSGFWDSIGRYVRVEFRVTVPRKYNVDLQTSGGSISVDDLEGEVMAKTSGGSLEFGRIKGSVRGRTSGGSIDLEECDGRVDVETSGGSIDIGKVRSDVRAHTSGGGIHVEEVMGTIDASTSGGSVTAKITRQPQSNCQLKTSGGGITVYMARDVKVNVDARTSGGRVSTDFPVTVQGELSKRSLHAPINGGGPELYLRTSGGSIYIREL